MDPPANQATLADLPARRQRPARSGAVLLIVVGLAAILLAIAGAVLAMNRSEAMDGALVAQDAQARIMLVAGLQFIQESSRLGWGVETYGWTDIRNGMVGPRGPRDPRSGVIPVPVGWEGSYPRDDDAETDPAGGRPGTSDPQRSTSPHDRSPDTSSTGSAGGKAKWPKPGSTYRGDFYAMTRPPAALRPVRHYNPIGFPVAKVLEWERAYDGKSVSSANDTYVGHMLNPSDADLSYLTNGGMRNTGTVIHPMTINYYQQKYWKELITDRMFTETRAGNPPVSQFALRPGFAGQMNPQPVADTLDDYLAGDPTPLAESSGRSWFRVYRETPADHDGDGSPWYDTVPISGHGVFIITCGSGATKGFRDWDEVESAGATVQFDGGRQLFEELRARERILWFRAEWTGATGGGFSALNMANNPQGRGGDDAGAQMLNHPIGGSSTASNRDFHQTINYSVSYFGAYRWIQRLERQPPVW